jgi:hypothetical protein
MCFACNEGAAIHRALVRDDIRRMVMDAGRH